VAKRVSWLLAAVTLVMLVLDVVVTAQYQHLLSEAAVAVHGFPFVDCAVLGCAVMGALIVSADPRHPIGWLLTLIGATSAVSLLAETYGVWVITEGGPGSRSAGGVALWFSAVIGGQLAIAAVAFMLLLAPDGRLLSSRWRYAAWITVAGGLLCVVGYLGYDPPAFRLDSSAPGSAFSAFLAVGLLLICAGLLAAMASLLLRLRRSSGEERRQVRLIALAAAFLTVGVAALIVVQSFNGGRQTWASSLPLLVAYVLLPLLFAVAVLRYRLYDIDVIINRAVVLTLATAFAAVGYTGLVVLVGTQVHTRAGDFWVSLVVTAAVALAFQPLRHAVLRLANRLAYGSRARPYEALSDFGRRLADTPSSSALLPAVAEAAGRAVSARGATVTLDVGAEPEPVSATWGAGVDGTTTSRAVPVRYDGTRLGEIVVRVPRGGPLRPGDLRLLAALADQTAVAFRNTAMELQLAAQVRELERATLEIARSRGRILEAEAAARRSLQEAISTQVMPLLASVSERLVEATAPGTDVGPAQVEGMVADVNTALEALRELTRGVFPTQLARVGLEPALRSMLARSAGPTTLCTDPSARRRFEARVEAAVYHCCVEATRAAAATITLGVEGSSLVLQVTGLPPSSIDVRGVTDRVEAAGGRVGSDQDALVLTFPLGPDRSPPQRSVVQARTSRSGPNEALAT
jgi:GAF domain-containing protein